jgi:quercetin dioxygenase-like cupin family protein
MRKEHAMRRIGGVWMFAAIALLATSCGPSDGGGDRAPALAKSPTDAGLAWAPCPPIFPAGCEIAVLHGDPAEPNADLYFRIPAGYAIPPHWHSSAERMILVGGALEVAYEGQPPTRLAVGDYAYGPAKRVHEARCVSDDACILFIAFEQPVDAHLVEEAAP